MTFFIQEPPTGLFQPPSRNTIGRVAFLSISVGSIEKNSHRPGAIFFAELNFSREKKIVAYDFILES